jgi:predicted small lipoprotein YifL
MKKLIIATVTLIIAASALSACGKRGALIPPDGSTYPQQYPKQ